MSGGVRLNTHSCVSLSRKLWFQFPARYVLRITPAIEFDQQRSRGWALAVHGTPPAVAGLPSAIVPVLFKHIGSRSTSPARPSVRPTTLISFPHVGKSHCSQHLQLILCNSLQYNRSLTVRIHPSTQLHPPIRGWQWRYL